MIRRDFLRKTSLALAGGLLVGPAALEAFERLTWRRKFWPGATFVGRPMHIAPGKVGQWSEWQVTPVGREEVIEWDGWVLRQFVIDHRKSPPRIRVETRRYSA